MIVDVDRDDDEEVEMLKLPDVTPPGIVRVAGVTANGLLELKETTAPPLGAGFPSDTVPVEGAPPATGLGDRTKPASGPGVIVIPAEADVPDTVAVMVAGVDEVTAKVVIEKLAEVTPKGTVTLNGTTALMELEDRLTITPPDGVGPSRMTVPMDVVPLGIESGVIVKLVGTGGVTNIDWDAVGTPMPNENRDCVLTETGNVVIGKEADVAPSGMVMVGFETAHWLLEETLTTAPPAGAGTLTKTVPVDGIPPSTVPGVMLARVTTSSSARTDCVSVLSIYETLMIDR